MGENLSKKEFDVLEILINETESLSQRQLEEKTDMSLSTINRTLKDLVKKGYVEEGLITNSGILAMEPYAAKRAVVIAAGFGSRMVPVTLNTPKPLVRVNGTRIIDTILDALLDAGIKEIYIVRGYLAEQFDQLLYKYPMIKFLENPIYNEANNISSAMVARFLMQNAYVCEADLLISNPKIIRKYNYQSNFLGIRKERTDDWCFTTNDKFITSQDVGGIDCFQEVGISYYDEEDGSKLSNHIKMAYESPGGKELYWDQTQFKVFKGEYKIEIRECSETDIVEIDTFNELKKIDKTYDV